MAKPHGTTKSSLRAFSSPEKKHLRFRDRRLLLFFFGVIGLILVVAVLFSSVLRRQLPDPTAQPGVGHLLGEVQLQGPATHQTVTEADLEGSIVLLHFWGLWCPPCRRELPMVSVVEAQWDRPPEVRVLAVACAMPGSSQSNLEVRRQVEPYLVDRGMGLPVYTDRGGVTRRNVAIAFGEGMALAGYPTTLLLDPELRIYAVWRGYRVGNQVQMEQQISRLLGQKQPSTRHPGR